MMSTCQPLYQVFAYTSTGPVRLPQVFKPVLAYIENNRTVGTWYIGTLYLVPGTRCSLTAGTGSMYKIIDQ